VASGLVIAAYLVPWAFGLGIYLSLRRNPGRIEALAVSWATGWAFINAATILANQIGRIAANETFFEILSGLIGVPGVLLLIREREKLMTLVRRPVVPRDLRESVGVAVLALLSAFLILVFYEAAITPPISTDAIVYHMRIPVLAWQTGYLPMNAGLGWLELANTFPNLLETQQLWIYLGANEANELSVRPIMPIYTSLLLLLVFADARRWFGLSSAAFAAAGLFTLNEFGSLSTVLWAEMPVALYSYLAIRSIAGEEGLRSRAASGVFAGMASLVKYNGLVLLLAVALASALTALRTRSRLTENRKRKRWFMSAAEFGIVIGAGLLACSPLLVRNLTFFGNPIYPFIWGGVNTETVSYFSGAYSLSDFFRFRIHEAIILVGSVLGLAFALCILRVRSWSRAETVFALTSFVYLVVFLYSPLAGSYVRYLAPIIPVAAAFGGRQLAWWLLDSDVRRNAIGVVLFLGMAATIVVLFAISDVKPDYLLQYVATFIAIGALLSVVTIAVRGTQTPRVEKVAVAVLAGVLLAPGIFAVAAERFPPREAALDFNLIPQDSQNFLATQFGDDWRTWHWIDLNLPVDALLLTFEARLFYLHRDVVFGSDHVLFPTFSMSLADAVAFVRALGIHHILDSPWSHIPDVNLVFWQRSVIFQNLANRSFFHPIHTEGQVVVYAIAR
jgi:hypothetical protein